MSKLFLYMALKFFAWYPLRVVAFPTPCTVCHKRNQSWVFLIIDFWKRVDDLSCRETNFCLAAPPLNSEHFLSLFWIIFKDFRTPCCFYCSLPSICRFAESLLSRMPAVPPSLTYASFLCSKITFFCYVILFSYKGFHWLFRILNTIEEPGP